MEVIWRRYPYAKKMYSDLITPFWSMSQSVMEGTELKTNHLWGIPDHYISEMAERPAASHYMQQAEA